VRGEVGVGRGTEPMPVVQVLEFEGEAQRLYSIVV
jgi:hypothetical protein